MQRGEKCRFRSFLVDGTAADDRLPKARLINQRCVRG